MHCGRLQKKYRADEGPSDRQWGPARALLCRPAWASHLGEPAQTHFHEELTRRAASEETTYALDRGLLASRTAHKLIFVS